MFDRYIRQTMLSEVSEDGQSRLNDTKILVVGAGGLGSSALQFLVGAGCCNITICDQDVVSQINLHRQTIYNENHIGLKKVEIAKSILCNLNSNCRISVIDNNINSENALQVIKDHKVILDCGDSFSLSYILSDTCYKLKKPFFTSSAIRFEGYVGGFCAEGPSLRSVFPDLPDDIENCNTAGILGPVVGVLGSMQAQMVINYILNLSPNPIGQMISINLKNYQFSSFRFDNATEPKQSNFKFISFNQIKENDLVIELRDKEELPFPKINNVIRIPIDEIEDKILQFDRNKHLIFVCKSGVRSWKAAKLIEEKWNNKISLIADNNENIS